jgi:NAD(P)-dependent dehydrogenase (short-subunit alcohol dehydrogenase family)
MTNKIALVTGANSGMGRATVAALADKGLHVVMLCRDERRGEEARAQIAQNPARSVDLMLCDLGSMQSIRRFTEAFRQKYGRLDVLVNNAGVITPARRETADRLELQFGVNHIGHFLLTLSLLGPLSQAASRIVIVGSGAYKIGRIHFDDYNLTRGYNAARSYGQSKLANLLFARELARRLNDRGVGVTVNVAHPGAVGTQMGVDRSTGFGKTIMKVLGTVFLTPEDGARTAVFLATDDSVAGVSGEYFYKSRVWPTSERGRDMAAARRLFDLSESICGLTLDEALTRNATNA